MSQIALLLAVAFIIGVILGAGVTIIFFVFVKRIDKSRNTPCNDPDFGIDKICFNCGVHASYHNLQ